MKRMTFLAAAARACVAATAIAGLVLASVPFDSRPAHAQDEAAEAGSAPGEIVEPAPGELADGEFRMVSDGEQKLHLVRHGDLWSMHAETLVAGTLFKLWHEAGGPDLESKIFLDHPFTLSVHRMRPERIIERVLEDYSYTLHYDARGGLELVRCYSAQPTRVYKAPRLVESLSGWRQAETASDGAAAAPGHGTAASAAPADGEPEPNAAAGSAP